MRAVGKDPVLLLSLVLALAGLALIYTISAGIQPERINLGDVSSGLTGRTVSTSGRISGVSLSPKGHIFLTIADNGKEIQVALFSDLVKSLNDGGIRAKDFSKGRTINVSGTLDFYNNQFQIVPRKAGDITIG